MVLQSIDLPFILTCNNSLTVTQHFISGQAEQWKGVDGFMKRGESAVVTPIASLFSLPPNHT